MALIIELIKHLDGEYKIITCCSDIAPCNDCRFCWKNDGCSINDEMQEVYEYLNKCDNVVIASPIWFSCLSGPILNIASRLQTLYCSRVFRKITKEPNKNGVIILVGGEGTDSGTETTPIKTALTIMRNMSVKIPSIATICSLDTNNIPAKYDEIALESVRKAASLLNNLYANKQKNENIFTSRVQIHPRKRCMDLNRPTFPQYRHSLV